ncbi:MAG: nitroreductase [Flavobacteriales bacterium]|nr:nitroreductase [Flavobacteriales bacterium]
MRHNLSEITAIIRDRRTIYPEFFSDRKVHHEQIELLLNNAIWAPTHGMTQPWRFKVYMGESRSRVAEFLSKTYVQWAGEDVNEMKAERMRVRPMKASAVMVVGITPDPKERIPEIEEMGAAACAIQNMHLTATAAGLGFFWSTPKFIYTGECNAFFGFEEKDSILGLIYIGYPEGEWPKGQRRPIEYLTEWHDD